MHAARTRFVFPPGKAAAIRETLETICNDYRQRCSSEVRALISKCEEGYSDFILDKIVVLSSVSKEKKGKYHFPLYYLKKTSRKEAEDCIVKWVKRTGLTVNGLQEVKHFGMSVLLFFAEKIYIPRYYFPTAKFFMHFYKKSKTLEGVSSKLANKTIPFLGARVEVTKTTNAVEVMIKPMNYFEKTKLYTALITKLKSLKPKEVKQIEDSNPTMPLEKPKKVKHKSFLSRLHLA